MIYARIASVLTCIYAACFGVPAVPVSIWVAHHDTLPTFETSSRCTAGRGGPFSSRHLHHRPVRVPDIDAGRRVDSGAALEGIEARRSGQRRPAARRGGVLVRVRAAIPWFIGLARATLVAFAWRSLK